MKTLLFLLAFLPLACSSEDPTPEVVQVDLYYLSLAPACTMSNLQKHQVTKDMYTKVLAMDDVGDCSVYHKFPDIKGVWHEGYLMGESKETSSN